jgi:hypothetical protein
MERLQEMIENILGPLEVAARYWAKLEAIWKFLKGK